MSILALQGIRGGVGTTSVAAALPWSLNMLDETVLIVDGSPDNLLRLFFNVDFSRQEGWGRALLDGRDWRSAAWRYTKHLDLLPFGQLHPDERDAALYGESTLGAFSEAITTLKQSGHYQWILFDVPYGSAPLSRALLALADHTLTVVNADTNCHVRLHQQPLPPDAHILLNDLRVGSKLQDDLLQIWLQSQRAMLPIYLHRDEALAECMAAKQPLGEYRADSLAAEEINTLANWCLLNYAGRGK